MTGNESYMWTLYNAQFLPGCEERLRHLCPGRCWNLTVLLMVLTKETAGANCMRRGSKYLNGKTFSEGDHQLLQ